LSSSVPSLASSSKCIVFFPVLIFSILSVPLLVHFSLIVSPVLCPSVLAFLILFTVLTTTVLCSKPRLCGAESFLRRCYGTWRFITVLARPCHWSLSWVRSSPHLPTLFPFQ
jgi:hypothetical protein